MAKQYETTYYLNLKTNPDDVINNLKQIQKQMESLSANPKMFDSIKKNLAQVEQLSRDFKAQLAQGIKTPNDFTKINKLIDQMEVEINSVTGELSNIQRNANKSFKFKNVEENNKKIKELNKELKELKKGVQESQQTLTQGLTNLGYSDKEANKLAKQVKTQEDLNKALKEELKTRQDLVITAMTSQESKIDATTADTLARMSRKHRFASKTEVNTQNSEYYSKTFQTIANEELAASVKSGQSFEQVLANIQKRAQEAGIEFRNWNTTAENVKQGYTRIQEDATKIKQETTDTYDNLVKLGQISDKGVTLNGSATSLIENSEIKTEDLEKIEKYEQDLKNLQQETSKLNTTNNLDIFRTSVDNASNSTKKMIDSLRTSNLETQQMAKQQSELSQTFDRLSYSVKMIFSLTNAYRQVNKVIRQTFSDVQKLDKAFASIAMVTDKTIGGLWETYDDYAEMANKLGQSTESAIQASALFYQQGLDTADALRLTEDTMKLATLAGADFSTATQQMTAALRGFHMEMDQGAHITDVYSELAAHAAADVNGIAYAMSKTASIANSAGMSFENTAAFLTQMIETTQEAPENIGTALKTVIARFTELKQNVAGTAESEFDDLDYNKVDKALKTVGISIKDASGQFRNLDDVFLELSSQWNTLDRNTQRYIATIAAGSRQQSRFIALMENYERTMELVDTAQNSAGKSNEQFAKYADSTEYKLNRLKNTWEQMRVTLLDSEMYKDIIDKANNVMATIKNMDWSQLLSVGTIGFIIGGSIVRNILASIKNSANEFSQIRSNIQKQLQTKADVYQTTKAERQAMKQITKGKNNYTYQQYDKAKAELQSIARLQGTINEQQRKAYLDLVSTNGVLSSLKSKGDEVQLQINGINTKIQEVENNETLTTAEKEKQLKTLNQEKQVLEEERSLLVNNTKEIEKQQTVLATKVQRLGVNASVDKIKTTAASSTIANQPIINTTPEPTEMRKALMGVQRSLTSAVSSGVSMGIMVGISSGNWKAALQTAVISALPMIIPSLLSLVGTGITTLLTGLAPKLAAIIMSPYTALALVLVTGITYFIHDALTKERREHEKWAKELKQKTEEAQQNAETSSTEVKNQQDELKNLDKLKQKYDELSAIALKTTEQQDDWKSTIADIVEIVPELKKYYDEENETLAIQNDLWDQILEKRQQLLQKDVEKNLKAQFDSAYTTSQQEYEDTKLLKQKSQAAELFRQAMNEALTDEYRYNSSLHMYTSNHGFNYYGTEIVDKIVEQTVDALKELDFDVDEDTLKDWLNITGETSYELLYQGTFNEDLLPDFSYVDDLKYKDIAENDEDIIKNAVKNVYVGKPEILKEYYTEQVIKNYKNASGIETSVDEYLAIKSNDDSEKAKQLAARGYSFGATDDELQKRNRAIAETLVKEQQVSQTIGQIKKLTQEQENDISNFFSEINTKTDDEIATFINNYKQQGIDLQKSFDGITKTRQKLVKSLEDKGLTNFSNATEENLQFLEKSSQNLLNSIKDEDIFKKFAEQANQYEDVVASTLLNIDWTLITPADAEKNCQTFIETMKDTLSSSDARKAWESFYNIAKEYNVSKFLITDDLGLEAYKKSIESQSDNFQETYSELLSAYVEAAGSGGDLKYATIKKLRKAELGEYLTNTPEHGQTIDIKKAQKALIDSAMAPLNDWNATLKAQEEYQQKAQRLANGTTAETIWKGNTSYRVDTSNEKLYKQYKDATDSERKSMNLGTELVKFFDEAIAAGADNLIQFVNGLKATNMEMSKQTPEIWLGYLGNLSETYESQVEAMQKLRDELEKNKDAVEDQKEKVEDSIEKINDAQEAIEKANKTLDEANKKMEEAVHGTEKFKSSLDGLINYTSGLKNVENAIEDIKDSLESVNESDEAQQLFGKLNNAYNEKNAYLQAQNKVLNDALGNLQSTLVSNYGNYISFDNDGNALIDFNYINMDANDELRKAFEEEYNLYEEYRDKIRDNEKSLQQVEKDRKEYRKQALNDYVGLQEKVIKTLEDQAKKEVEITKEKYEAMSEADSEYLNALQKALDKQQKLREQEKSWNDLAEQEKKLSLMRRDTSGANSKETLSLEKNIEDNREQLLKNSVDNIVSELSELYEKQKEARDLEIEYMEDVTENAQYFNDWAHTIMNNWTNSADMMDWFMQTNPEVKDMTIEQQEKYMQELQDDYKSYAIYTALLKTDIEEKTNDLAERIDGLYYNISDNIINIGTVTQDVAQAAADESVASAQEAIDSAYDAIAAAEEQMEEAKKVHQDNLTKLTELEEKVEETQKKLTAAQDLVSQNYGMVIDEMVKASEIGFESVAQAAIKQLSELTGYDLADEEQAQEFAEKYGYVSESGYSANFVAAVKAMGGNADNYNIREEDLRPWGVWIQPKGENRNPHMVAHGTTYEDAYADFEEYIADPNHAKLYPDGYTFDIRHYADGGLVNYTGPAWVDGTPQKPEAFLNAEDTTRIGQAAKLLASLPIFDSNNFSTSAPVNSGDVNIEIHLNVESISDDYSVDQMMERMKQDIVAAAQPTGTPVILFK